MFIILCLLYYVCYIYYVYYIMFRASSLIIYIITGSFMMLFDFIQIFRQRLLTSLANAITVYLTSL